VVSLPDRLIHDSAAMRVLYLTSVWIHILAAIIWIGGMTFLVLVLVPWLRAGGRARGAALLRDIGGRFRTVGWICFAVLLVTGSVNLWARGVRVVDLTSSHWWQVPFARALAWKLGVFALVLLASALHDFWLGPRASVLMQQAPETGATERLRRAAALIGRSNLLFAMALVAFGIILVRGWP
jgi:putative copper resistance protein D